MLRFNILLVLCYLSSCSPSATGDGSAQILQYDFQRQGEAQYTFSYETSNGIKREETGDEIPSIHNANNNAARVRGSFSYPGADGKMYSVTFLADEAGFHPEGDHILIPPFTPWIPGQPIDEGQYIPDNSGQYIPDDSGRYRPENGEGDDSPIVDDKGFEPKKVDFQPKISAFQPKSPQNNLVLPSTNPGFPSNNLFPNTPSFPPKSSQKKLGLSPRNPGFPSSNVFPNKPGFQPTNPGLPQNNLGPNNPGFQPTNPQSPPINPVFPQTNVGPNNPSLEPNLPQSNVGPENPGFQPANPEPPQNNLGPENPGFKPENFVYPQENPEFKPKNEIEPRTPLDSEKDQPKYTSGERILNTFRSTPQLTTTPKYLPTLEPQKTSYISGENILDTYLMPKKPPSATTPQEENIPDVYRESSRPTPKYLPSFTTTDVPLDNDLIHKAYFNQPTPHPEISLHSTSESS